MFGEGKILHEGEVHPLTPPAMDTGGVVPPARRLLFRTTVPLKNHREMKNRNEMTSDLGFGFTSGKTLFGMWNLKLGNFEYRKAGAKDGSHNWPVLHLKVTDPTTTKFFEEDFNFKNAMTPSDVEKLSGKTIVDFEGWWGRYLERKVDPETGEVSVEPVDAEWPKVTKLYLSDGSTFEPSGDKIAFGAVGYIPEPEKQEEPAADAAAEQNA